MVFTTVPPWWAPTHASHWIHMRVRVRPALPCPRYLRKHRVRPVIDRLFILPSMVFTIAQHKSLPRALRPYRPIPRPRGRIISRRNHTCGFTAYALPLATVLPAAFTVGLPLQTAPRLFPRFITPVYLTVSPGTAHPGLRIYHVPESSTAGVFGAL